MPTYYLDTETTGLGEARVVEVALCDDNGPVFESLVNPGIPIPAEASAIHGITDELVAAAPTLDQILPKIEAVLADADRLVIFNRQYDERFFPKGFFKVRVDCAMMRFAAFNARRGRGNVFPKLEKAAEFIGYVWTGVAHRAMADALAAAAVWRYLEANFPILPDCPVSIDGYARLDRQTARLESKILGRPVEIDAATVFSGPLPTRPLRKGDTIMALEQTHANIRAGRPPRENIRWSAGESEELRAAWAAVQTPGAVARFACDAYRSPLSTANRLLELEPGLAPETVGIAIVEGQALFTTPIPEDPPTEVALEAVLPASPTPHYPTGTDMFATLVRL